MALLLLDIEKALHGPDREAAMRRYDALLVALDERLGRALAEGMPPNAYARAEALRAATTLARKLLRITVRGE